MCDTRWHRLRGSRCCCATLAVIRAAVSGACGPCLVIVACRLLPTNDACLQASLLTFVMFSIMLCCGPGAKDEATGGCVPTSMEQRWVSNTKTTLLVLHRPLLCLPACVGWTWLACARPSSPSHTSTVIIVIVARDAGVDAVHPAVLLQ